MLDIINVLGAIFSILIALSVFWISYRTYKIESKPSLDVTILLLTNAAYKNIQKLFSNKPINSPTGLYLFVQLTNIRKRPVTPQMIFADKNAITAIINNNDFGYELKDGESYKNVFPLNQNQIENMSNAKKIYVLDTLNISHKLSRKKSNKLLKDISKK